jgi:ribosomal protein L23
MTMYIRLKRKNQTVFLHVEPSDNFFQIKQRVAENFNIEPSGIMLFAQDKV